MKKYVAESIGTAVLVIFGCGTAVAINNPAVTGAAPLAVKVLTIAFAFGLSIVAMGFRWNAFRQLPLHSGVFPKGSSGLWLYGQRRTHPRPHQSYRHKRFAFLRDNLWHSAGNAFGLLPTLQQDTKLGSREALSGCAGLSRLRCGKRETQPSVHPSEQGSSFVSGAFRPERLFLFVHHKRGRFSSKAGTRCA